MASEWAYTCGNNMYFVVEHYGHLVVQRQDWLGRTFVGYARNLADATALNHRGVALGAHRTCGPATVKPLTKD
jgi:hypothetical protein